MLLNEILTLMDGWEDDIEHQDALNRTGFWGAQGAGSIIMARTTQRFLIAHRSRAVEQPGTWGTWGGAIDKGEDPEIAARREVLEEAGHAEHLAMLPLYVFTKGTFRYSNFLAIVDDEFRPDLNWETQGFRWCHFGQWPAPLHFGLAAVLNDRKSIATIKKAMATQDRGQSPQSPRPKPTTSLD